MEGTYDHIHGNTMNLSRAVSNDWESLQSIDSHGFKNYLAINDLLKAKWLCLKIKSIYQMTMRIYLQAYHLWIASDWFSRAINQRTSYFISSDSSTFVFTLKLFSNLKRNIQDTNYFFISIYIPRNSRKLHNFPESSIINFKNVR